MAKKEKTPLPDEGSDSLITILSIATAFVASVTLALGIGIAVQYTSTNAAIMPEETVSSQQVVQPAQGQVSQTGTEKNDISEPSGSEDAPDDGDTAGEPADEPEGSDEPEGHEEPPQDINPPQADTPSASSTQPTSSNPGTSTSKTDPPKSSGTNPSNTNSGTNSGSTVTIKPNQPKTNTSNNNSNSGGGSGNGNNFNTYNNQNQQQTTAQWVLNTSTKKIHYPSCRDVPKIAAENYSTSNLSEAELISQGYSTCGHCH